MLIYRIRRADFVDLYSIIAPWYYIMIRSIILFFSLVKLALLLGCNTRFHASDDHDSPARLIKTNPSICRQEYMKFRISYSCENLLYAVVDDRKHSFPESLSFNGTSSIEGS